MEPEPTPRWLIIISSLLFAGFTAAAFAGGSNWKRGWLFVISGAFGFLLKYGPFGFTCSFRSMLSSGDFSQMRDMFFMMFFSTLFIALLQIKDWVKHPFFFPEKLTFGKAQEKVGLSLAFGAFMFGMGMQLGSGCATGTLVGMGEGSLKSWLVIWFFIAGATIGALNPVYNWWSKLPTTKVVTLDWWWVLVILFALILLTYLGDFIRKRLNSRNSAKNSIELGLAETKRLMTIGSEEDDFSKKNMKKFWHNLIVDLLLGVIIASFFVSDGQVIGVMGVFPLIGGTVLKWCGCKVGDWDYYKNGHPLPKNFLDTDMFLSDVFIMLGAFLAATIKRNFGQGQKKTWDEYVKGVFGGLLMGLGGRMSAGCNIGSMLSGINSCSMHGFTWMVCAIIGSWVVVGLTQLYDKIKTKRQNSGYNAIY